MKPSRPIIINRPGHRLKFTPSEGMSEADIAAEIEKTWEFVESLRSDGTQGRLRSRKIGRMKFGRYLFKNVGPPPWRFPRLMGTVSRRGFEICAGWRSTAYTVGFVVIFGEKRP